MEEVIEYVIYCRKSTDESSGMQTQSIPDQIQKCVKYAKDNWITIMKKPDDFSDFESEKEIKKEQQEKDIQNRRLYEKTNNLFIIKEQQSWKIPWARTKRTKLVKLIKKWKIKWLLSYSPDRQARNLMEWWELINLVDEWLVELKYTNFHFERNASWKMMLWIWFVFSKQYSDKLSEDITRGIWTAVSKGKSIGNYKYWYYRDEETWYDMPHPKYFDLMKQAFKMRIYEKKSDVIIADWLNANWFIREWKNQNKKVSSKNLWRVREDHFYYWMYITNTQTVDLRNSSINPYYKPMITVDEYDLLNERRSKNKEKYTLQKRKDIFNQVSPLERDIVKTEDWYSLSHNIPNVKRHKDKLAILKKTNPKAKLKDIIQPHQMRYKCSNKHSKHTWLDVTYEHIDKHLQQLFNQLHIDDKAYEEYKLYINEQLDKQVQENQRRANVIQFEINKLEWKKAEYIKRNMHIKKDNDEEWIYQTQKKDFDNMIEVLKGERTWIEDNARDTLLEFEVFVQILQKAPLYYKKATYVQKRKISSLFVSNITVTSKKQVIIKVYPQLGDLFWWKIQFGGDDRTRTGVWKS